jgi:hypothetical protein
MRIFVAVEDDLSLAFARRLIAGQPTLEVAPRKPAIAILLTFSPIFFLARSIRFKQKLPIFRF